MGRRWTPRGLSGERFCGNKDRKEVHDLDHEDAGCQIDEIIRTCNHPAFRTFQCAQDQGYHSCPYCCRGLEERHL